MLIAICSHYAQKKRRVLTPLEKLPEIEKKIEQKRLEKQKKRLEKKMQKHLDEKAARKLGKAELNEKPEPHEDAVTFKVRMFANPSPLTPCRASDPNPTRPTRTSQKS